jgi:hypothetical protein
MSHKKTADDNPQINFCGYPLILLSESGFQKSSYAFSMAHRTGKVLALPSPLPVERTCTD